MEYPDQVDRRLEKTVERLTSATKSADSAKNYYGQERNGFEMGETVFTTG